MRSLSIRWRLTVWYALALTAGLALFGGLLWLSLRHTLLSDVDANLAATAERFQTYFAREAAFRPPARVPERLTDELEEFSQALPPSEHLELLGSTGFQFRYPASWKPAGPSRSLSRHFVVGTDEYTLGITESLTPIQHTLDLLKWLLIGLVPFVIAISTAGGAWLSRRALTPVDAITSAARTIGIGNLSMRLPVSETGDELQRLAEVWNTMLARLETAVNVLSQFSADASHELRTPLAVIRTSAELALRRARDSESYRLSLREIADEADRMSHLVEDLLFLARNESQALPMTAVDLADVLAENCEELRALASERGISIRREPPSGSETVVCGNRQALRRLFLTLLDNAVKYSLAGLEVIVTLADRAGEISVEIEDHGIGIGSADLPHIFQRFYQADKSRNDSGFGLGLSLAESIARMHGAAIDVKSQPGDGSTFRVVFKTQGVAPKQVTGNSNTASRPILTSSTSGS